MQRGIDFAGNYDTDDIVDELGQQDCITFPGSLDDNISRLSALTDLVFVIVPFKMVTYLDVKLDDCHRDHMHKFLYREKQWKFLLGVDNLNL